MRTPQRCILHAAPAHDVDPERGPGCQGVRGGDLTQGVEGVAGEEVDEEEKGESGEICG